jgi:ABC-type antimicrobial peptide transport system permease subunit
LQIYLPFSQNAVSVASIVVKTGGAPYAAAPLIRDAVRSVDPDQATFDEKSLGDVERETFARPREAAWLIGTFAAIALLLSAVGVYGVMAYLTAARAREIGIRIALGATRLDILSMVVGDAMRLTGVGVTIGIAATPFAMRLAGASIAGAAVWRPAIAIGVAVLLATICAAAAAIPARRAARSAALSFR